MKRPLRIGFLPFYVDYYENLSPDFGPGKREEIRDCREVLTEHGKVIGPAEPICDLDSARRARHILQDEGVDCIVALCVIAVFAEIPDAALEGLDQPLLLWHHQRIQTVDANYSMVEIVRNTGQIGVQAFANVLGRVGRPFQALCASAESMATKHGLDHFFAMARAGRAMRNARVLQVGEIFPQMSDILISEAHLQTLGAEVTTISAKELTQVCEKFSPEEVGAEVEYMQQTWTLGDITADELQRSARIWLAVRVFAQRTDPTCATINSHGLNCLRNPSIGVTATYAISRLNASGIPCSEVGDIPTAQAMAAVNALTGDALYTEVQVLDEIRDAIVLANSGESAESLFCRDEPIRLGGNANFRGLHGRGASFSCPLSDGPVSVVSLSPTGQTGFHLVAMEGEILEEHLPDAGTITGFFRPAHAGLHDSYRQWVEAGAVHHAATCQGHRSQQLSQLATLMGWRFTSI